MKQWLEIIGDLTLAGFGFAMSIAFIQIYVLGYTVVGESNPLILKAEIVLSIFTFLMGIYHYIQDMRGI